MSQSLIPCFLGRVPRDLRGSQCTSYSPCPHPLSSRKLKKAIKLPSNRYLPTPNISFSPSSLHFRPVFPLLLTFSGHFFLPILFLSPQNKDGVGGRLDDFFLGRICFPSLINCDQRCTIAIFWVYIWDCLLDLRFVSLLGCLQIIFPLISLSLSRKSHMNLP